MEETNVVSSWKCTLDWCSYGKPHNLRRLQTTAGKVIKLSASSLTILNDLNRWLQFTQYRKGLSRQEWRREKLIGWVTLNRLHLVYYAKQGGNVESGRWGMTTSPDLWFVSRDKNDQPLRVSIPQKFSKSEHKPIVIETGITLPWINKLVIPRRNLRKAK